jgi:hypothetical protein
MSKRETVKGFGIYAWIVEVGDITYYYIGSTNQKNGFAKRVSNHLSRLRKGTYCYKVFQDAFNNDPTTVMFEPLEICFDDEVLSKREQWYVNHFNSIDNCIVVNKNKPNRGRHNKVNDTSRMCAAQKGINNPNAHTDIKTIIKIK